MKNMLIFIALLLTTLSGKSQFCSYVISPTSSNSTLKGYVDQNTPVKQVLINIYYLLKFDGTGNFNELNDGLSPSNAYNGYQYAWDLIYGYNGTRVPILKYAQGGTNAILENTR